MAMKAISLISLKGGHSESRKPATPLQGTVDFDNFVPRMCKQFQCPILITIDKKMMRYRTTSQESKYSGMSHQLSAAKGTPILSPKHRRGPDNSLHVTAVYDRFRELVEILIRKSYIPVPRTLMKVIALAVPYTRSLTKFTIKQCGIDKYTIYELSKILIISNITDICLDHSPLKEGNYDILLSDSSSLRSLSLSRCNINDIICERIASRLLRHEPAEPTLMILNLSSNQITDVGLKYFGEALRTNRHLRYLNVADNQIGDDGAKYIFEVLAEFPLNTDEILDKNMCYLQYLKDKHTANMLNMDNNKKLGEEVTSTDNKGAHNGSVYLNKTPQPVTSELLEPFEHPFSPSMVTIKRGQSYCIGNFTLCYLNLRYNNLTYQSVQRLAAVVRHQKIYRNENLCGLLNVLLEGNYVPEESDKIINLNNDMFGKSQYKRISFKSQ